MFTFRTSVLAAAAFFTCASSAVATEGEASRGAQALRDLGCVNCHGANRLDFRAPDLTRRYSRGFTPSDIACVLWNHGAFRPSLFQASINENQMADLFAYFASRRFFEPPGNARDGKQVFTEKHCAECHGLREPIEHGASAVNTWRSLSDPIAFSQEIWNRSPEINQALGRRGLRHPSLTAREVNDLLVYLENAPAARVGEANFKFDTGGDGRQLFESKGCAACHQGNLSLEKRAAHSNMADVAAAMWNHAPVAAENRQRVTYDEMAQLVGYVWSAEAQGRDRKGETVFARKNCVSCHDSGVLTDIATGRRDLPPFFVLAGMGAHGAAVVSEMNAKGIAWPRLSSADMADVAEYLAINPSSEEVCQNNSPFKPNSTRRGRCIPR